MSILHRIESIGDNHIEGRVVEFSFDTKYRGKWQCRCVESGLREFSSEPPFETLSQDEQDTIRDIIKYVYYYTHGEIPKV